MIKDDKIKTTRYKFYIMVKNQQTRLRLIKYLVAEKIPEYNFNSVNTLSYDPVTGKEGREVIYGVEFWADLPLGCDMDVFDMITTKFDKKIQFCYSRIIKPPKVKNIKKNIKKNITDLEFSDAWGEESEKTASVPKEEEEEEEEDEEIELGESEPKTDEAIDELTALNEFENRALQDQPSEGQQLEQIEEPQV